MIFRFRIPWQFIRGSPPSLSHIESFVFLHSLHREFTTAYRNQRLLRRIKAYQKNEYKIEGISFEYHVDKFSKNMKSIVSLSSISTKSTKPTEGEFHFYGYRHPKSCPQTPTFLTFASNPTVERTATSQWFDETRKDLERKENYTYETRKKEKYTYTEQPRN